MQSKKTIQDYNGIKRNMGCQIQRMLIIREGVGFKKENGKEQSVL